MRRVWKIRTDSEKIQKQISFCLYFELSFSLWNWHFEHFIILSNSFLQWWIQQCREIIAFCIYNSFCIILFVETLFVFKFFYKKVLKVRKVDSWHIQGCVSPGEGEFSNTDNAGQGGVLKIHHFAGHPLWMTPNNCSKIAS
jgi:hypothetical protein